ncbi:MAG: DUF3644 domain-containing protein [Armatimonadota bacterium]
MSSEILDKMTIELLPTDVERMMRQVNGQGGLQSLFRRLKTCIKQNNVEISFNDAEKISRYASEYGPGGYQGRFPDYLIDACSTMIIRKRMLDKSIESYILALETINRLSIQYRFEAFSIFLCNAWELLLKVKLLVENPHIATIQQDDATGDHTIGIKLCINKIFTKPDDPIRLNLEDVVDYRNNATHYIVPLLPKEVLGLFQSCVINYHSLLQTWMGIHLRDRVTAGMMSIVYDFDPENFDINSARMKTQLSPRSVIYLTALKKKILERQGSMPDSDQYMIDINYKLGLVKNPKKGDIILTTGNSSQTVGILSVPTDPGKTHPFVHCTLCSEIGKLIGKQFFQLTSTQMTYIIAFYKWSSGDEYYFQGTVPASSRQYSAKCVELLAKEISEDANFVEKCRDAYRNNR